MLILPIVNRNRILNVHVKLKDVEKIRKGIKFEDAEESEVVVNGKKMSDSIYKDIKEDTAVVDFIRNNSLNYRRNFLVTTREETNSAFYDVYEVKQPPKKINKQLDSLYSSVITDMRKEIPGVKRGRYISLEKLGFNEYLTDEKITRLQRIVKDVRDERQWPELFEAAGVADLRDTIEFINNFDCTVISDTTIPEDKFGEILKPLEILNTQDSRKLRNYYNMALTNKEIYGKLSYINKIIYDRPLNLIQSKSQKQKKLVKKPNESEYSKVA